MSNVEHPKHYGGKDNPYEAIKVIEAWELGFHLGNAVKYIARAGKKGSKREDLEKAVWYISRELKLDDPTEPYICRVTCKPCKRNCKTTCRLL
jgi:hypothetical protein